MTDRRTDPSTLTEQYVAAIVQNAEDAIISKNLDSIVTSWNPAAERIFGYTAKEMIGQSVMRILPPDLAYEEVDILERIRRGERVEHFETRRLRKDGTAIDVSLTIVVDDDSDTCGMIRAVLKQCGCIVTAATDADTALETFLSWKPTILISDIGLPEVDGYELMRRIRNEERTRGTKTPAIALTAFARIEDRVKALAAGYQMHVAKPVEPGELLTIVASLAGFMDRR